MNPYTFAAETAANAHFDRQVALALISLFSAIMLNRKTLDTLARLMADSGPSYNCAVLRQQALRATERSCDRRYFEQRLAHHDQRAASSKRPGLRLVRSAPEPHCMGVEDMRKPTDMVEHPIASHGIDSEQAGTP